MLDTKPGILPVLTLVTHVRVNMLTLARLYEDGLNRLVLRLARLS